MLSECDSPVGEFLASVIERAEIPPNPKQSWTELSEEGKCNLAQFGVAYFWTVRNSIGEMCEVHCIPNDQISKDGNVYLISKNDGSIPYWTPDIYECRVTPMSEKKKTVFIEVPEGILFSQEMVEKMYSGLNKRAPNIDFVILANGIHAVSADGPRYGIEESLSEYTYKCWGESKEEVMAMREEIIHPMKEIVYAVEPTAPKVDQAMMDDMTKRLREKYASGANFGKTIVKPPAIDEAAVEKIVDKAIDRFMNKPITNHFVTGMTVVQPHASGTATANIGNGWTFNGKMLTPPADPLPSFSERLLAAGTHVRCRCQAIIARTSIVCHECHAKTVVESCSSEYESHTEEEFAAMKAKMHEIQPASNDGPPCRKCGGFVEAEYAMYCRGCYAKGDTAKDGIPRCGECSKHLNIDKTVCIECYAAVKNVIQRAAQKADAKPFDPVAILGDVLRNEWATVRGIKCEEPGFGARMVSDSMVAEFTRDEVDAIMKLRRNFGKGIVAPPSRSWLEDTIDGVQIAPPPVLPDGISPLTMTGKWLDMTVTTTPNSVPITTTQAGVRTQTTVPVNATLIAPPGEWVEESDDEKVWSKVPANSTATKKLCRNCKPGYKGPIWHNSWLERGDAADTSDTVEKVKWREFL